MMSVEQSVEWELVKETKVLGENIPPVEICPLKILCNLTWNQTWAANAKAGGQLLEL
jgi:hypothetical protein